MATCRRIFTIEIQNDFRSLLLLFTCGLMWSVPTTAQETTLRLATFSADVTIPIGHRCMGILDMKAQRIDDPLEARGFVLLGPDAPVVFWR